MTQGKVLIRACTCGYVYVERLFAVDNERTKASHCPRCGQDGAQIVDTEPTLLDGIRKAQILRTMAGAHSSTELAATPSAEIKLTA